MGAARARGSYADRVAQAKARGPVERHVPAPLPMPAALAGHDIVAVKVKNERSGEVEIHYRRKRDAQAGIVDSADGRARYQFDGVCLRRVKERAS